MTEREREELATVEEIRRLAARQARIAKRRIMDKCIYLMKRAMRDHG